MTMRTPTSGRSTPARHRPDDRTRRGPDLERQSISFTVGLYLFIVVALLLAHVTAGGVA
ncbi:hypothetical protein [Cellulosimicrobium sp. Marseille-Q8652]